MHIVSPVGEACNKRIADQISLIKQKNERKTRSRGCFMSGAYLINGVFVRCRPYAFLLQEMSLCRPCLDRTDTKGVLIC